MRAQKRQKGLCRKSHQAGGLNGEAIHFIALLGGLRVAINQAAKGPYLPFTGYSRHQGDLQTQMVFPTGKLIKMENSDDRQDVTGGDSKATTKPFSISKQVGM